VGAPIPRPASQTFPHIQTAATLEEPEEAVRADPLPHLGRELRDGGAALVRGRDHTLVLAGPAGYSWPASPAGLGGAAPHRNLHLLTVHALVIPFYHVWSRSRASEHTMRPWSSSTRLHRALLHPWTLMGFSSRIPKEALSRSRPMVDG